MNEGNNIGICRQQTQTWQTQIAYFFDQNNWKIGETYRMRVSHIFDLSKFWIVLLEQELTVFQKFLNSFYDKNKQQFQISVDEELRSKMYCVAFSDGGFYRGMILDIPLLTDTKQKAIVFLIDFGYIAPVQFEHLYHCYEKLYQVPSFAVRASLTQVQPCDSETWTGSVIQRFNELVYEKVLLCILENIDPINRVVYISIADVDQYSQIHDIGDTLLNENLAVPLTTKRKAKKYRKLHALRNYSYQYPTFQAIEQSEQPPNAKVFELLKQSRAAVNLLASYYKFDEKT